MIYTNRNTQFLGGDVSTWAADSLADVQSKDPNRSAASDSDVAGAVGAGFKAAGDIFSSFFKYKSDEVKANKAQPTTIPAQSGGMDKNTKTALIIGGSAAAAALILVVALK